MIKKNPLFDAYLEDTPNQYPTLIKVEKNEQSCP
jgi:hypothetical protein